MRRETQRTGKRQWHNQRGSNQPYQTATAIERGIAYRNLDPSKGSKRGDKRQQGRK